MWKAYGDEIRATRTAIFMMQWHAFGAEFLGTTWKGKLMAS